VIGPAAAARVAAFRSFLSLEGLSLLVLPSREFSYVYPRRQHRQLGHHNRYCSHISTAIDYDGRAQTRPFRDLTDNQTAVCDYDARLFTIQAQSQLRVTMRLLYFGDHGEVSLTRDLLGNDKIPPYAILSHTWGKEEVTFDDITEGTGKEKIGHNKIRFCMQKAVESGLQYSWVDTCCINKNDFTELQHAINSFFRWYRDAAICYVFLSDVSATKRKPDSDIFQSTWEPAFRDSRWFTRGWTLQELLAPRYLKFYSQEGKALGDMQELKHLIHSITGLPVAALLGASLDGFEPEERLSWTDNRTTTREEDKAYSLLGILGVFMPLIYGEGLDNAFRRLRKEIQDRKYLTLGTVRMTFT
jgi:hypothetical protein